MLPSSCIFPNSLLWKLRTDETRECKNSELNIVPKLFTYFNQQESHWCNIRLVSMLKANQELECTYMARQQISLSPYNPLNHKSMSACLNGRRHLFSLPLSFTPPLPGSLAFFFLNRASSVRVKLLLLPLKFSPESWVKVLCRAVYKWMQLLHGDLPLSGVWGWPVAEDGWATLAALCVEATCSAVHHWLLCLAAQVRDIHLWHWLCVITLNILIVSQSFMTGLPIHKSFFR